MSIGDHIRALKGGRWVHGIDCGDRTIIYFSAYAANGGPGPGFRRRSWSELGAEKVAVVTHTERVFPPKMVVARAFSRLREAAFNQMFADSEQFAAWCKSGRLGPAARSAVLPVPVAAPAKRKAAQSRPAKAKARAAVRAAAKRSAKRKAAPPAAKKAAAKTKARREPKAAARKKAAPKRLARAKPKKRR